MASTRAPATQLLQSCSNLLWKNSGSPGMWYGPKVRLKHNIKAHWMERPPKMKSLCAFWARLQCW